MAGASLQSILVKHGSSKYDIGMDSILEGVQANLYACGVAEDATLLLAFSGGADSMALLHMLHTLQRQGYFGRLMAAHLHHGIRGVSADRDAAFVKTATEEWGIPLKVGYADVPAISREKGVTIEAAARETRYTFLREEKAACGASHIVTAHHMEDQAETVLLHMLRGSGLGGLCGMQMQREDILRPLLHVTKEALLSYNEANRLFWCTDETNRDMCYGRNRIRMELMPMLKTYNPNIVKGLCSMAGLLYEDDAYLELLAAKAQQDALISKEGVQVYNKKKLFDAPMPVRSRAIRLALKEAGALYDMQRSGIESVCALLTAATGTYRPLPRGLRAWVSYDALHIGAYTEREDMQPVPFLWPEEIKTPQGCIQSKIVPALRKDEGAFVAYMDAEKIPLGAVARQRQPGDRIHPLGAPGSRKLKEFLIDKKIERHARRTPMIAWEDEALFFPGGGISERLRVTDNTTKILRVEYIDEKNAGREDAEP